MSKRKRYSASTSSRQSSQPKRSSSAQLNQRWKSERNVSRSCSEEEDLRRVVRGELEHQMADFCQSWMGKTLECLADRMHSVENSLQEVKEALKHANVHPTHLARLNATSTAYDDGRNLQLQLRTILPCTIYTGKKLGEGSPPISVDLIDVNTGNVVSSGRESSVTLDVVVVDGDFNKDNKKNWSPEEFEKCVVEERGAKGPVLIGDLRVKLMEGVGELGVLKFHDNSSWIKSRTFRLGLKVESGYCGKSRIREGITGAFRVLERRGELYEKHYPPASEDEVWRLETISKGGSPHKNLNEAGMHTVEDFLLQLFTDSKKLYEILNVRKKMRDSLIDHATTCETTWRLYLDCSGGMRKHGVVFNIDDQPIGLIKGREYFATHRLSPDQKKHVDEITQRAYENWNDVRVFNGETFSGSMRKKSSSSFPSSGFRGQIESHTPAPCNLAPRGCATVGSEAPPANAGFTAEGPRDGTALALPAESRNAGDVVRISVDDLSFTHNQTRFADGFNDSRGDYNITAARFPAEPHDIRSQYAMNGQMINSSSRMENAEYENVLPSGLPHLSLSASPTSWPSSLPGPAMFSESPGNSFFSGLSPPLP